MLAAPANARHTHNPFRYQCMVPDCNRHFLSRQGLVKHLRTVHATFRHRHTHSSSPAASSGLCPSLPQSDPCSNASPSSSLFSDQIAPSSPFASGSFHQGPEELAPFSPALFVFPDGDQAPASCPEPFLGEGRQQSHTPSELSHHHTNLPKRQFHPFLNGKFVNVAFCAFVMFYIGVPCDEDGHQLPVGAVPSPRHARTPDDWTPFNNCVEFELADFIYHCNQMSALDIDVLLDIWAAQLFKHGNHPPFANHQDLYKTLDLMPLANACWQNLTAVYQGDKPDVVPPWMDATCNIWLRDPLTVVRELVGNHDFHGEFDYAPYHEFEPNGEC